MSGDPEAELEGGPAVVAEPVAAAEPAVEAEAEAEAEVEAEAEAEAEAGAVAAAAAAAEAEVGPEGESAAATVPAAEAKPAAPLPQPSEPERRADYSILHNRRLVAYLWMTEEGGVLCRAGGIVADDEPIRAVPFAEIRTFNRHAAAILTELITKSKSVDALLFKLGMEGFDVETGAVAPSAAMRRF